MVCRNRFLGVEERLTAFGCELPRTACASFQDAFGPFAAGNTLAQPAAPGQTVEPRAARFFFPPKRLGNELSDRLQNSNRRFDGTELKSILNMQKRATADLAGV